MNRHGKPLQSTSIAGYVKTIKTVFNLARRTRLITKSPFEWIKKGSFVNPAGRFLDACPSQSWRVLFVL
ncbi:MAG: phage integrase SAM-like domain-containing protein [Thermoguttaceae bacterium]